MGNQQRHAPYQGNPNYQHGNNANYGQGWRQYSRTVSMPNQYQNYQHQQNTNHLDRTSKLEDTLQQFMQQSMANQKNTDASIKNLETQVGQISKQLSKQQRGTFTTTTQANPKEHCKAITTRSEKMLNTNDDENKRSVVENREEEEKKREEKKKEGENNNKEEVVEKEQERKGGNESETNESRKNRKTTKEK